jgi:hypothetical protein
VHSGTGLDALGKKKKLPLLEIKLIYVKSFLTCLRKMLKYFTSKLRSPRREERYISNLSLTPELDGGEWSMKYHRRFTPGKDNRYSP